MQKIRRGKGDILATVVVLLLISLTGLLFADDGDADLLRKAKNIFGPLPQVMLSEKNPVTPEGVP